jgi:adenylosuccinate lyase
MIPRYSTPELDAIWSPQAKFELWLEIETLLIEVFEQRNEAPAGTAALIRDKVTINADRILEIEQTTHHDVIAFLTHIEEQVGEPSRYVHLGLTSSDVGDTALCAQLTRALDAVAEELDTFIEVVAAGARKYAKMPMIGRTHGIHAEPTTFGLLWGMWKAELDRDRARLAKAREMIAVGKLSGAVGTYAHLDTEAEEYVLSRLGLRAEPIATQVVQRDRHAEVFTTLAIMAATIEKIAVEIRHLQRTEVGEAEEPFRKGQKGSSAMPHKRNPIRTENVTGLARVVRGNAMVALENVALWHQRDISHSSAERVIGPDSTTLLHFMYRRMSSVLKDLKVYPERMMKNLEMTGGFPFSQTVLLALVRKGLVRQEAYVMVQNVAMKCFEEGGKLYDALHADETICSHLSKEELDQCFDLEHMFRNVDELLDRVL